MNICLVYDCLFPWTIGGAERWYRNLGEKLADQGHNITYLTMRQWDEPPRVEGIEIVSVAPPMPLYRNGKRRLLPPLRFGIGVLRHLLWHGRRYDVVHTASFPYFSLLAAGLARANGRFRIVCDWHEVWSREYWAEYLGRFGSVGWVIQKLCARVPQKAYAFSRLHSERLRRLGLASVTQLTGEYAPEREPTRRDKAAVPPCVVYAGRFIPEKRLPLLLDAFALVSEKMPHLRLQLIGDGPTRSDILARIEAMGLNDVVSCPGFVSRDALDEAMAGALCVVQPSRREGYGMVVVEAAHRAVPAIVVAAPDNAATELISEGHNGFVVPSPDPAALADAIALCETRGTGLRRSTRQWYSENERLLALETSMEIVIQEYVADGAVPRIESPELSQC